jgi:hypothetical protein
LDEMLTALDEGIALKHAPLKTTRLKRYAPRADAFQDAFQYILAWPRARGPSMRLQAGGRTCGYRPAGDCVRLSKLWIHFWMRRFAPAGRVQIMTRAVREPARCTAGCDLCLWRHRALD